MTDMEYYEECIDDVRIIRRAQNNLETPRVYDRIENQIEEIVEELCREFGFDSARVWGDINAKGPK